MNDKDSQLIWEIWEAAQLILDEGRTSVVNPDSGNDLTDQYINPKVTKYIDEWVLKTYNTNNIYEIVAKEMFKDIELVVARYDPEQGLFQRAWGHNARRERRQGEVRGEELADEKEKLAKMEQTLEKMKSTSDGSYEAKQDIGLYAMEITAVERSIKSKTREIRQNYVQGEKPENYNDAWQSGKDTGLEYLVRHWMMKDFEKVRKRLISMWQEFRKHLEDGRFGSQLYPVRTADNHDWDAQVWSLEDIDATMFANDHPGETWSKIEDELKDIVNSNQTFDDDEKLSILSAIRR